MSVLIAGGIRSPKGEKCAVLERQGVAYEKKELAQLRKIVIIHKRKVPWGLLGKKAKRR